MLKVKQVIVIRRDLKMRRGKEIAQGAHASMKFICDRLRVDRQLGFLQRVRIVIDLLLGRNLSVRTFLPMPPAVLEWIDGSFSKICLKVETEAELMDIKEKAEAAGLMCRLIEDNGATEFHGVKTKTCLAIGPDYSEKIDPITKGLGLY